MKNFALSLTTVAIIGLVIYILFLQECRGPDQEIPDGFTLIADSTLASMNAVEDLPPDTVFIDTGSTRIIIEYRSRPIPVPIPMDIETNFYSDSVKTDTVNFWIEATIIGILKDWSWKFDILQTEITKVVEISKPVPVEIGIPVMQRGLYAGIRIGGGTHTGKFMFGADLDLITKKENIYGVNYIRFGDDNLIGFKAGIKIRNPFK